MNAAPNSSRGRPGGLRRLLVINQVAGPLMRELLEDLSAAGVRCTLVTGWLDAEPEQELPFEVAYARRLTKAPAWRRLWSWGLFTAQALWRATRQRCPMVVVTNPPWPMLAMPLLRRLLGLRYVLLVYDIYPDILERMGRLSSAGCCARLWRRLSARALARSAGVITLGRHMAETLRRHLADWGDVPLYVIDNWADTDFIRPLAKADNPFARRHGLVDKFVVSYSGAFGATHDMESIVAAAEALLDLPDVHFLLIGGGTRQREVSEVVARKALPNLTLLPLQPFDMLRYTLPAADCAIVSLDEGYEGLSVPSKTYYALAAGAALLAISGPGTELTELVAEHGCGVHIPPRSPEALAGAIRRLHDDRELLSAYKSAARRAAERHFSRRTTTARYLECLERWLGRGARW